MYSNLPKLPTSYDSKQVRSHGNHEIFESLRWSLQQSSYMLMWAIDGTHEVNMALGCGVIGLNASLFHGSLITSNTVGCQASVSEFQQASTWKHSKQQLIMSFSTYLIADVSYSWRDLVLTLARKRHLTLSCAKDMITRRYGIIPLQFLRPLCPPLAVVLLSMPCCCCALSRRSRSLNTSFVKIFLSTTPRIGLWLSHSSIWILV